MNKKTRRSKVKYPGLEKPFNLKNRRELIDQDYIHKLTPEEKEWLSNFNEEYNSANFNHEGERIHPVKVKEKIVKATGKKRKVDKFKKDCEDRNNARNRDSYSVIRVDSKKTESFIESNRSTNEHETEDAIIAVLDGEKEPT